MNTTPESNPENVAPIRGYIDEVRITQGEARYGRKKRSRFLFLDTPDAGHTHVDENGFIVRCYHKTRRVLLDWGFWLGTLISFPLEHFLYEKVWPFTLISKALGL